MTNGSAAIAYTYDANNNIASYVRGGNTVAFTYDELNQITRENNQEINKTITYAYDAGGNITTKTEYDYTTGTLGTSGKDVYILIW
jgi:YD repeat-containing protein